MSDSKKAVKAPLFFLLGIVGLLAILGEYTVIAVEESLFGKITKDFTITESVTHWIVICVLWGLTALMLFYISARVYGFDIEKKTKRPTMRGNVVALLLLSSSIGVKYLLLGGWQMAVDFKREGWFQFIFLYIYYLFEAALLVLSSALLQEGCERLLKKTTDHIPWGGIVLALTWGLTHFMTSGDFRMAIFYTAVAFFIGCAHLAAKKNIYFSYIFAAVLIVV